jgi:serine/threonine protein kinase
MPEPPLPEESIFAQALEIRSAAERAAFLDRTCGANLALRAEVEALLRANERSGDLLDLPENLAVTLDASAAEGPGTIIGPYKLLQQIGEGGMGTVFMAEQTHPVQRKVALKVIKAGMDSRQVIARFEAERQALALMEHINIARVLDAGATEAGRPYFVMELVHGVPITTYCDDNRLTPHERLELFVPVCQAIQHAHQKGIIHRDVKPSNVMVTLYDGRPVPKVIDFGVAKATEQRLTERTLFTHYGTLVGTLEYMSPEQAEMSALGVDTRSDIYSLGVLLYELLTGSTPLTHKRVREAAYGEILRVIREEEPPRPSTRLSDSGETLASISAQRKTEPAKLARLMRGELDWVVMKCLEKDRNRRYETAKDFAVDVQRYLNDEPVLACPPSAGYRLRKFARRNKGLLTATMLIAIALVVGTVVSAWQARNANVRRVEAETARQEAIVNLQQAREAVDQMLTRVSEEKLFNTPQTELLRKALLEDALKFYRRFLRQAGSDPAVRLGTGEAYRRTGQIYRQLGHPDQAERAYREAIALLEKLVTDSPIDPANRLALALSYH